MAFNKSLLIKLRIQNNLTQQALADAILVENTTVRRLESHKGSYNPNFKTVEMLCDLFGVTMDEFRIKER